MLHEVDLDLYPGAVHGLVGQNGSGKSTLIKILAGYHHPDQGASLTIAGRAVSLPIRSGDAHRLGLSFVHQDLGLVPSMSILDNILIRRGYRTARGGRIRWAAERRRVRELLRAFDLDFDPDIPVSRLTHAEQAILAVVRVFEELEAAGGVGIIVLDEPTSQLSGPDVQRLFSAIRKSVARGASAIFVSHRLDEVQAITDTVSVLRDGHRVGTVRTSDIDERGLLRLVLGRHIGEVYPEPPQASHGLLLSVRDLTGEMVRGLSLALRVGEVLGVTGLVGMGHDEVPYLLVGANKPLAGRIVLQGEEFKKLTPRAAIHAGIGLLPADRQHRSSMQTATVRENVALPVTNNYFRGGFLRHRLERRDIFALLARFDVRPPEPERIFRSLSGGNQQKALLAKWLQMKPSVLLLHEPTHGVDVGARKQIFEVIRQTANEGSGILFCSAEYEDLAHLCDRVLILRGGRVAVELSGDHLTEQSIIEHVYAGVSQSKSREGG